LEICCSLYAASNTEHTGTSLQNIIIQTENYNSVFEIFSWYWKGGLAKSFLGIHKWKFVCSVCVTVVDKILIRCHILLSLPFKKEDQIWYKGRFSFVFFPWCAFAGVLGTAQWVHWVSFKTFLCWFFILHVKIFIWNNVLKRNRALSLNLNIRWSISKLYCNIYIYGLWDGRQWLITTAMR
jgi:hypothetical protein